MIRAVANLIEAVRTPPLKQVFFRSLPYNRKLMIWYAGKVVRKDSRVENPENLQKIEVLRKQFRPLTFISNHLTYADSHIIEVLLMRSGFKELADHLVHIAGQKTFQLSRRVMTRSLNTIRVYQPKAKIDTSLKKRMNFRALKWANHLKKRGFSLMVFPEGTRTRYEKKFNLFAANPKITIYFRQTQVVPLALMGSERILPLGSVLPRPAQVLLRVGNPIDHSEVENTFQKQNPEISEKELRQMMMLHYMKKIDALLHPEYRLEGD